MERIMSLPDAVGRGFDSPMISLPPLPDGMTMSSPELTPNDDDDDDAMEGMFHDPDEHPEKFCVSGLVGIGPPMVPWNPGYSVEDVMVLRQVTIGDQSIKADDYSWHHRTDSFPMIHHPLKPHHHHHHHHHHAKRRTHRHRSSSESHTVPISKAGPIIQSESINQIGSLSQSGPIRREEPFSQIDYLAQERPISHTGLNDQDRPINQTGESNATEQGVPRKVSQPVEFHRVESDLEKESVDVNGLDHEETTENKSESPLKTFRRKIARSFSEATFNIQKPFFSLTPNTGQELDADQEVSPLLVDLKPCIQVTGPGVPEKEPHPYKEGQAQKNSTVQFQIGDDETEFNAENTDKYRRRKTGRCYSHAEDPSIRCHPGSHHELPIVPMSAITQEEAENLEEHHLDDMTSHRFDEPSAYHRHRSLRGKLSVVSSSQPGEKADNQRIFKQFLPVKKSIDHSPHEIFVELDELVEYGTGNHEWRERARWIKYEEDVEGAGNRWGKAHIAFLNFHSLFSLRKGLDSGVILLDLVEHELPVIAARVVDRMVASDQIPSDHRDSVLRILLLKHKHIKENHSSFKIPSRPSKTHLKSFNTNIFHGSTFRRTNSMTHNDAIINRDNSSKDVKQTLENVDSFTQIDVEGSSHHINRNFSKDDLHKNNDILRKIPDDAEATAVLVGAVEFLKQPTVAFVRLAEGVLMDNFLEVPIPVRFIFILLGPVDGDMDYHEVGRSISTLMSDKNFHEVAYRAHSRGQLLSAINEFLNTSIVLPPSDWSNKDLMPLDEICAKAQENVKKNQLKRIAKSVLTDPSIKDKADDQPPPRDPLQRVGQPFYGLIEDLKFRMPLYLSDIKDGLNGQVVAATIFIYFAALSAAITFGGMYGDQMNNLIGVGECLLMSSINGILFALFAAQPLLIVGATGPLMIFDMSLYAFCIGYDVEFLPMRFWIGFWVTIFGLLVAAFEAVAIVRKFTRFTEEIFSTLVCLIFIYESFFKMYGIFKLHPLVADYCIFDENSTDYEEDWQENNSTSFNKTAVIPDVMAQPNTALLSLILMMGTFFIAFKLKHFRNSKFLGRSVRRALGDFGVPISIILMVSLDYVIQDTYTDKIKMPDGLQPSNPAVRGWIINPLGISKPLPIWCIIVAAPASLLLFILLFLEENICQLILSKPEKKMKKGSGFHWDLVLSCFINATSGLVGAPFMGPACVRTVSHTSALIVMSTTHAPGESPKIVGVIEQRVSALLVSALVGLSVFLTVALNLVPKSVLLGIFLYMGISATAGIQLLERTVLFLVPVKYHPNVPYVKKVRTPKMHIFTTVQIVLLLVLWVVKQSPAALCFPFVLMLLIPIRLYLLPFGFNKVELNALDGHEASSALKEDDELDFFEETHNLPTDLNHNHQS